MLPEVKKLPIIWYRYTVRNGFKLSISL